MSKPAHSWHFIVLRVLRNYPELYSRREQLRQQSVTAGYAGIPGGGGNTRKTEAAALRELSPREESDLDAVIKTIKAAEKWKDGELALRIIEMVDWRQTHTIRGAEMQLNLRENFGKKLRSRFINELARNLGYK
jgi:hypothetical protein